MRFVLASSAIASMALGFIASRGHAEGASNPKPIALIYSRGPGTDQCPDEEQLRDGVAGRLGFDPFESSAGGSTSAPSTSSPPTSVSAVSARITKDGTTLRAKVEILDAAGTVTGSRELSSNKNDCVELASAMTLTISMVIDPSGKQAPTPLPLPSPTSVSSSVSTSATPELPPKTVSESIVAKPIAPSTNVAVDNDRGGQPIDEPTVDRAKDAGTEPLRVRLGVAGQGALGFAPRSSFGATAAIGIDLHTLSIDLEGRRDLPTTSAAKGGGRGEISTSVSLASIVPCVHRGVAFACAVVSLGSLQAKGLGVDVSMAKSSVFLGVGLRGGVEWPIFPSFSLVARLEILAPLIRTSVRLEGDEVWSAPTLAGSLGLGAIVFF